MRLSNRSLRPCRATALLAACSLCSLIGTASGQSVVISEFVASNGGSLVDEDGESSDWIELFNSGTIAVDLTGWTLTDDAYDPTKWVLPGEVLVPGQHLVVFASGKNRAVAGQELHTNFSLDKDGEYLGLYTSTAAVATEFAPMFPPQRTDVAYGTGGVQSVLVAEGGACEAHVPQSGVLGNTWQQGSVTGWLTGATGVGYERGSGYESLISLDIESQMYNVNSTAYIRSTFQVANPAAFATLTLRMKYDDGFYAWLNGVPLARGSAPEVLQWNSAATSGRNETLAVQFEDHDVTASLGALQAGTNVLAIQGLNATVNSSDFLIVPELVAGGYGTVVGYLLSPTPGTTNGATVAGFVDSVATSVERGFYSSPFTVTLSTSTAGATIRYTTDGTVPDETNGTVYTVPIAITGSTVLRAGATLAGWAPSDTTTQSYLFSNDVFSQPRVVPGQPTTWGGPGSGGGSTNADYEMDPRVINDPAYAPRLQVALDSHPVVSLTMDPAHLFAPSTGIYISPNNDPPVPREVPTSVEYFEPQGSGAFQIDAGVRVTGNNSTRRWGSKKLSLRLLFKDEYGPTKLEYPILPAPATTSFDTLTLDAYFAFTWSYATYYTSMSEWQYRWRSAQYMRDHFAPTMHAKMGSRATTGKYVHLFINGLYWGVYNVHERPDDAFNVAYRGGQKEDWDVIRHNQNNVQSGNNASWLALMALVDQGGGSYVQTAAGYAAVQQELDVVNLIDYMLLNFYIGFHADWPTSNWYAARNRVDPTSKWQMFSWDAEHSLKDVNQNSTQFSTAGSPARPYHRLRQNTEFQVLFGDRVHKMMFNDGPLYVNPQNPSWNPAQPDNNRPAAHYASIADSIEDAMILESARWGDTFVTSGPPYTVNAHWKVERDRLLNQYFPPRHGIVLSQLRAINLYPNVVAPTFSQHGGPVQAGFALAMTAPAGTILYTTDGSDPRLPGGAIAPSALAYERPITIDETTTVKARVRSGGSWSALDEARFTVEAISINELLASNTSGIVDEFGEHEDWIELYNASLTPAPASGLYLTDDPSRPTKWQIPPGYTINPGETLLIWADEDGNQGPLHANFKLASGGEQVQLFDVDGETLLGEIEFGPQVSDISTGWMTDGGELLVTFLDPSPAARNEITCGSRRYSAQDPTTQPLVLSLSGTPGVGQVPTLISAGGQGNAGHALFASVAPAEISLPFSVSKQLIASLGLLAPLTAGPTGIVQLALPIPPVPALAGTRLYFQDWTVLGSALVASSGLEIVICP